MEPWCSDIYINDKELIAKYILEEQKNTLFDLSNRVHHNEGYTLKNYILISFDGVILNKAERVIFLQSLSRYLTSNKQIGKKRHDIFDLNITTLEASSNIGVKPIHSLENIIKDNIKDLLS